MTASYIAEPLPGIRQEGDTAPSSKREAIRWLSSELGITGAQAHRLFDAYRADLADAATAHAVAVEAGRFDDARQVVRETFRAWFTRRGDVVVSRGVARQGRDYRPRDDRGRLL
jgi:hypothetical protein